MASGRARAAPAIVSIAAVSTAGTAIVCTAIVSSAIVSSAIVSSAIVGSAIARTAIVSIAAHLARGAHAQPAVTARHEQRADRVVEGRDGQRHPGLEQHLVRVRVRVRVGGRLLPGAW